MKILLADDHTLVREGLAMMIQALFPHSHIQQATNWPDVHRHISNQSFALALLDIFMPGKHAGWEEELTTLFQSAPSLPVCIVSGAGTHTHIRTAFELGVKGYIHKTATTSDFSLALNHILSGRIYLPPQTWHPLARQEPEHAPITHRQRELLALMAEGHSNKEIGLRLNLSEGTVKRHFYNIFRSLHVSNRVEAIQLARRQGILQD